MATFGIWLAIFDIWLPQLKTLPTYVVPMTIQHFQVSDLMMVKTFRRRVAKIFHLQPGKSA